MADDDAPPAGWYRNPVDGSTEWWWDGARWHPGSGQATSPPEQPTGVRAVVVLLLISAAFAAAAGVGLGLMARALEGDSGQVTHGVVIDLNTSGGDSAAGSAGSCAPVVQFQTAAGRTFTTDGMQIVSPCPWNQGQRVKVRYYPDDPEAAEVLTGPKQGPLVQAIQRAALLLLALAVGLMVAAGLLRRRRRPTPPDPWDPLRDPGPH